MSFFGIGVSGVQLLERPVGGILGSFLYGATFSLGWSACVGPILGALLTMLATQGIAVAQGALLAFVYALGLGTPLIVISTFFNRLGSGSRFWQIIKGKAYDSLTGLTTEQRVLARDVRQLRDLFDKQKNQLKLIEACENIDNIEVIFVGDGPLLEQTKNKIKKIDTRKFIFKGLITDVNALLSDSTIFALISNWEGFPMSTLEAMSHGLPVLVSNVGGACECVLDEVNGYRVNKSASTIEIGNLLHKMLANKTQLLMMSANSRKIYLENFTDEIMYKNTFNHFTFLLSAHG
jgi:hypothetical protein